MFILLHYIVTQHFYTFQNNNCAKSSYDILPHKDRTSLVAQTVKNPPAMQETQVLSLGWEDTLEKGMATHSNILAWRIPRTEEPGGLQSMGSQSWTQLTD